ncbi:MAG: protein kinase domain-containing protein [Candidatus Marinamargulisbacteria bacterium]
MRVSANNGQSFHVNKNRIGIQFLKQIWKLASKCLNKDLKSCEKTEISIRQISLSPQITKEISSIVPQPINENTKRPTHKDINIEQTSFRAQIPIEQNQSNTLLPVSKIGQRLFKIGEEELQFDKNSKYTSAVGQTGKIRGPVESERFGKVVIKRVRINKEQDRHLEFQNTGEKVSNSEDWKQEVEMHKKLQKALGKNVVQLYGVSNEGENRGKDNVIREYMVLEHLEKTFEEGVEGFSVEEMNKKCLTLINLIEDMHTKGFAHGDFHDKNIMIRDDGSLALIDFGKTVSKNHECFEEVKDRDKEFLNNMLPTKLMNIVDLYNSKDHLNIPISKLLFAKLNEIEKEIILKFLQLDLEQMDDISENFPSLADWGSLITENGLNDEYYQFTSIFNSLMSSLNLGDRCEDEEKEYCFQLLENIPNINENVKNYVKDSLGLESK